MRARRSQAWAREREGSGKVPEAEEGVVSGGVVALHPGVCVKGEWVGEELSVGDEAVLKAAALRRHDWC